MPTTWNAIFLGNSATEIDAIEGNNIAENAGLLAGQNYGSVGDPLANHVVSVATSDLGGGSGLLDTDQFSSSDLVSYDLGGGLQNEVMDGVAAYNATLTYMDGSTATITAVLFQDGSGNLFLAPQVSANADSAAMEAFGIRSMSLDSMITNDASLTQDRHLTAFPCFAEGTLISTPSGAVAVEKIGEGDLVTTMDNGPQPVVWRGGRTLTFETKINEEQRPVEIKRGALGSGMPHRRLVVSPQHRVLIQTKTSEQLAPAKGLTDLKGLRRMNGCREITYHTLLLGHHHILFAEGLPVESFYPGPFGLAALAPLARLQILVRFPGLSASVQDGYGSLARAALTRRDSEHWVQANKGLGLGEFSGLPTPKSAGMDL